ncbi:MAG: type II secretion system minor pseudopilin GspI [Ferrovum sp.]|nr:type II secretion system minor pseudopilin GspI [Ferrovum sp.]
MRTSATGNLEQGFSLLEVLVALFIMALSLGAGMRTLGGATRVGEAVPARLAAQWSAVNALDELRLARSWPGIGSQDFSCAQGRYRFVCHQVVTDTPNPSFRRVEVGVTQEGEAPVLAHVITVIPDNPAQVL